MQRFARILDLLLPLACIGAGAWLLSPAAGLLSVGALLWIDDRLDRRKESR